MYAVSTALPNVVEAEKLHRKWYGLFRDLFIEANPVPIKTALAPEAEADR